ncbi:ABC transporter ATP-binding protein [Candidatus Puniceispirillum sp.]|uniref:ABC transporter ATP-binding protein n=1 Tax=Candidatus Puniceispirillum sp. TaxID=2026719 RepID=UPI003F698D7E
MIVILTIIGAGLETLGLGLILPVLSVIMNPENFINNDVLYYFGSMLNEFSQIELMVGGMLVLGMAYLIKGLYLAFMIWRQSEYIYDIKSALSDELLNSYLHVGYEFHIQNNTGNLIRNITIETQQFVANVLIPSVRLFSELSVVIAIVALLIYIEPSGAFYLMVIVGISMAAFQYITRIRLMRWGQARQQFEGKRIQKAQEALGGIKDAKLLGKEQEFLDQYSHFNWQSSYIERKQLTLSQLPYIWLEIVAVAGLAFLVIFLVMRGADASQILPILGVFGAAAFRIIPSANRILMALQALRYSVAVIDLMDEELHRTEPADHSEMNKISFEREIRLDQLFYQYPSTASPSIMDINLQINKGESVGIVGTSGAGKSTLVDVILGLLPPTSGRILIDDVDAHSGLRTWQDHIGYVPQHIFLSDETLRRNIAFGVPEDEINNTEIDRAIRQAQLNEFVDSMPDGINTTVGERGVRLSGGQRQRIGVARALYHNPSVLVLDEASSALDTKTEAALMEEIYDMQGERTLIIIAHRLSTIEKCDRIFHLEKGKLVGAK